MTERKKLKRAIERNRKRPSETRIVTYVRVLKSDHRRIADIATARGYPHTIASVAAEMITRGLDAWLAEVSKGAAT